jgi:uncharacterized protein (DUF433 family)/endonuclease III
VEQKAELGHAYIEMRGRTWFIAGSAAPLEELVRMYRRGLHPEAMMRRLPGLSPEQVYGAVACYLSRKDEIDRSFQRQGPAIPRVHALHGLVRAVAAVAGDPSRRSRLESWKQHAARFGEPDFIWDALVRTTATMGNSRGAELLANPELHARIRYSALRGLAPAAREEALIGALRAAGVRMPARKTEWLLENFERIEARGGPEAVKEQLESFPGRSGKIAFLKTFRGIGDKQARNLMMDVYHPDFRNSIAVDERITRVSARLGLALANDREAEEFFLEVARSAGMEGWELDRLLYHYNREVLDALPGR